MTLPGPRPFGYQSLMPFLVKDVLLVASPYDRFILEEDGRFADRLLSQYVEMDLSTPPHFDHVPTAVEAFARLDSRPYDLVLTTPHCAGLTPLQLAARISRSHPETPVVMLTYDRADALFYSQHGRAQGLEQVFLWTGDPRLLVALVKSVEDLRNVDHDTREGNVRVILLVEDSPAFYSSYLPIIYTEVLSQVSSLLAERINERDRHQRMRARPKILLARNYEEGVELFQRYHEYLLGTICDMRFPRQGEADEQAGLHYIRLLREQEPDVPVLLQSSETRHRDLAQRLHVHFADKNSPELLRHLRRFMRSDFGFGSFIFRLPTGEEVARASNMREMLAALRTVPEESLRYHGERNHISNWLMARSEFALALEVRPRRVSDFRSEAALRDYLVEAFEAFLERRQRGEITEYARSGDLDRDFIRLGRGSMGGKARSIAFVSYQLAEDPIHAEFPAVRIAAPRTAVLCTDWFDRFCEKGQLKERALATWDDAEVVRLFLEQPLDPELMADLRAFLERVHYPLAVRSSSLQEDSEFQPLAGLYQTWMLPNDAADLDQRLEELSRAIRRIYASVFTTDARHYLQANGLRVEEEKMAVVLQRLVGRRHGDRFYPDFSGVAQSHNFYPMGYMQPEDGIASVALGFGQSIVEGRRALRFCPRHPLVLPQIASPTDALRLSQRHFYALDLSPTNRSQELHDHANLVLLDLDQAEADGTLEAIGSTYVPENDTVYDTIQRPGPRIVSFAGVLKHGRFPLAEALAELLALWRRGLGTEVEMEFAVALEDGDKPAELAVLQLRPLVVAADDAVVDLERVARQGEALVASPALGNGVLRDLGHVVYIDPRHFDFARSTEVAALVGRVNHELATRHEGYVLIGPGRWGTADPWLGLPVAWRQVSSARVIVEVEQPGSHIDPSQGTHFFHNLTALRTGYFTVDSANADDVLDLDYLDSLPAILDEKGLRMVKLPHPVAAYIDGRSRRGIVLRPSLSSLGSSSLGSQGLGQ